MKAGKTIPLFVLLAVPFFIIKNTWADDPLLTIPSSSSLKSSSIDANNSIGPAPGISPDKSLTTSDFLSEDTPLTPSQPISFLQIKRISTKKNKKGQVVSFLEEIKD